MLKGSKNLVLQYEIYKYSIKAWLSNTIGVQFFQNPSHPSLEFSYKPAVVGRE